MPQIKDALIDFNPWWKQPFTVEYKQRELYARIQQVLSLPQIIALTGLRRVGKTTLLYKIVKDAIANGVAPQNIIYFSFDEFITTELRELLHTYEELVKKDIHQGAYLVLLDEIQKLNNWESQLKAIYDTFGKNLKIIISGSESLFIRRKSKGTLAGRLFEFKVEQLSFKEFLSFKGVIWEPIELHQRELRILFHEFSRTLGFPELVNIHEKEIIKKYIKEGLIEKIVYGDLPHLFKIKDITLLESLLNIFTEEPGPLVDISDLARELKISRQTLAQYLRYLEETFLIRKLYNWSSNRRKVERKLKKFYPTIVSVDLLFKEDDFSKSKVFEWLIVNQLKGEFFWRDPYKHEVDLILVNKEPIPIEIKYGKIETDGLRAFMHTFKIDEGYILSSSLEEKRSIEKKNIFIIPAFTFLLEERYLKVLHEDSILEKSKKTAARLFKK